MPIQPLIPIFQRGMNTSAMSEFERVLSQQQALSRAITGGQGNIPRQTVLTLMDDVSKIKLDSLIPYNKVMQFAKALEEWQANYLSDFAEMFNIFEKDEKIQQEVERQLEGELLENIKKGISKEIKEELIKQQQAKLPKSRKNKTPEEIEFSTFNELTQMITNAAKAFYTDNVITPVKNLKTFQRLSAAMEEFWQNAIKMVDMEKETDELLEVARAKETRGAYKNYNVHARQYNKMVDAQDELLRTRDELQENIYSEMRNMDIRPLAFYRTIRTNAFEPQLGELKPLRDGIVEDMKRMAELEGKTDALSKSEYKKLKKAIRAKQDRIKEIDGLNRKTIQEYGISADRVSSLYLEKPETPPEQLPKRKKPIFVMNGKEL